MASGLRDSMTGVGLGQVYTLCVIKTQSLNVLKL